ncbi:hypothetical protein Dip518_000261 [Parelusimicrobium proximum]|uniref:hypothetical protein n=1 Tax=Parelusimicrobium proximum TaxID=3228953 RepID=UPI003D1794AC
MKKIILPLLILSFTAGVSSAQEADKKYPWKRTLKNPALEKKAESIITAQMTFAEIKETADKFLVTIIVKNERNDFIMARGSGVAVNYKGENYILSSFGIALSHKSSKYNTIYLKEGAFFHTLNIIDTDSGRITLLKPSAPSVFDNMEPLSLQSLSLNSEMLVQTMSYPFSYKEKKQVFNFSDQYISPFCTSSASGEKIYLLNSARETNYNFYNKDKGRDADGLGRGSAGGAVIWQNSLAGIILLYSDIEADEREKKASGQKYFVFPSDQIIELIERYLQSGK